MTADASLTTVEFGSQVELELIDRQNQIEVLSLTIVRAAQADLDQGLLSEEAPLARAILGKAVGRTVPYQQGELVKVRILHASRTKLSGLEDQAARRQAVLQKARDAAERTNAEMFASSFSSKWGDYELSDDDPWENPPDSQA